MLASGRTEPRLGIVGGGRAAAMFARTWLRVGWPLAGFHLRPSSSSTLPERLGVSRLHLAALSSSADLILLAVHDGDIAAVATALREHSPGVLFHASGSLPSSALEHSRSFSLHPLRSLPPAHADETLAGTLLVFEGSSDCLSLVNDFASRAGARLARITPEQKVEYHAAAVFASNYVAALADLASSMLASIGTSGNDEEVAALASSALSNWLSGDGAGRFTGPVARGDAATVGQHIDRLSVNEPQRAILYAELALELLSALRRHGAPENSVAQIDRLIRDRLDIP